ncbi:MAG: hypothetical protein MNSN_05430 [Minisyncoccus archaeiphilus]|jgi:DNA-binding NtrC family response regulator|uniref:response regulator n=1 Tax=Minisyncoccus archaeiphilus TaxID=3238481 RepID=UPI0009D4BC2D|nr:MAG: Phosphate regulon transcriptional regulatory protein PhoB [Parcubacteria group bacterium ADurb.Bin216]GMX59542.1 MAG: hypothetical protein MNSN_05430 [Candidatus Parcubacteria bacterium]
MKVLYIEDDPIQVMMMGSKFKLEGVECFSADTCEKAFDIASDEKPNVILLDILLGGDNGLDILEEFRKHKATKDIPTIVFSNYMDNKSLERSEQLGAVDYIVKLGMTPKRMVEIVKEYVEQNSKKTVKA